MRDLPKEKIKEGFKKVLEKINHFDIASPDLLPEGLKPHTRSICWIAEQIILQNLRKYKVECGFTSVDMPSSDIVVYDCIIKIPEFKDPVYVNVKVNNVERTSGRNDISKAPALVQFYSENKDALLYDFIIRIRFDNTRIFLNVADAIIFNVAWIENLYVKPSNHHLQAEYSTRQIKRTNQEFVELLKQQLKEKNIYFKES